MDPVNDDVAGGVRTDTGEGSSAHDVHGVGLALRSESRGDLIAVNVDRAAAESEGHIEGHVNVVAIDYTIEAAWAVPAGVGGACEIDRVRDAEGDPPGVADLIRGPILTDQSDGVAELCWQSTLEGILLGCLPEGDAFPRVVICDGDNRTRDEDPSSAVFPDLVLDHQLKHVASVRRNGF